MFLHQVFIKSKSMQTNFNNQKFFIVNPKLILTLATFTAAAILSLQIANAQTTWNLAGNSNATSVSKLGTTKAISLRLTTNNQTRIYINANNGNVGIGTGIVVNQVTDWK